MFHNTVAIASSVFAFAALATAQEHSRVPGGSLLRRTGAPPVEVSGPSGRIALTGDMPLTTQAAFTGSVDVFVEGLPYPGGSGTGGTFTVSGIPAGADVLQAWLLITSFDPFAGAAVQAFFDGNDLGSKVADVVDPGGGLSCSLYRFDVTSLVTGDGSYAYSATGQSGVYGDALVVVYEHASLPPKTIVVNDGAESLQQSTTTTTFDGLPTGNGELMVFVQADNASGPEEVRLNGTTVAGPADLFAANLGNFASLETFAVTAVSGVNTVDIVTSDDWFGAHLAILSVEGVGLEVALDIRPQSCPNPLNTSNLGVLPVAILGEADLDVTEIDPASLFLEGVPPTKIGFEDVETPFGSSSGKADCLADCNAGGPDGLLDLTAKFNIQAIVDVLGPISNGECRVLELRGRLKDEFGGDSIRGEDVVLLRVPPTPSPTTRFRLIGSSSIQGTDPGSLFEIDVDTGVATLLATPPNTPNGLSDVTYDPDTGTLYAIHGAAVRGAELLNLDAATGALISATPVTNPVQSVFGSDALAFDDTGTLFAGLWSPGRLATVNKNTAVVLTDVPVTGSGGVEHLADLAFDPTTGSLWASRGGSSGGLKRLLILNPVTAQATFLLTPSSGDTITAIAFGPDGTLYGSLNGNQLATIDKATGLVTPIGAGFGGPKIAGLGAIRRNKTTSVQLAPSF